MLAAFFATKAAGTRTAARGACQGSLPQGAHVFGVVPIAWLSKLSFPPTAAAASCCDLYSDDHTRQPVELEDGLRLSGVPRGDAP